MDKSVFRKESKRWVAPKTSYEGDDWGNDEYDEYETYDELPEENESSHETPHERSHERPHEPVKPLHALSSISEEQSQPTFPPEKTTHEPKEEESSNQSKAEAKAGSEPEPKVEPKAEIKPSKEPEESTPSMPQETTPPKHQTHREFSGSSGHSDEATDSKNENGNTSNENEDELDSSIQDIYGFYENRYSSHPYSAMLTESHTSGTANEFSDSTASLSTGRYSVDSGAPDAQRSIDPRSSIDYQPELDKVPEVYSENSDPYASSVHEREMPQVDRLHIRKGHSRDASLDTEKSLDATSNAQLDGKPTSERPVSQVLDADIAELYQGSSEFLNRPISTYNPMPQRDISDQSIKDLLTPRMEQEEFDTPTPDKQKNTQVPSLFVTSASPDPNSTAKQDLNSEKESMEGDGKNTPIASQYSSFEHDHDYVDNPGFQDSDDQHDGDNSDSDSSSINTQSNPNADADAGFDEAHKDAPKELTSESEERGLDSTEVSSQYDSFHHDEAKSLTQPGDSEPFILPSELKRLNATPSLSTFDEKHSDKLSDTQSDIQSFGGHRHKDSEASATSDATGVTSSSNHTESLDESKDSESVGNSERSTSASDTHVGHGQATENSTEAKGLDVQGDQAPTKAPQPISSKVKRPPQVDFSALLNKSGTSSETRCEQMRILRSREAEYSSGLETWLMATMDQVDNNFKIHVNGVPPTGDANSLDLPTTAKVTNAMHSSATNTKEKLGKVGEKSKSFFAKVIR